MRKLWFTPLAKGNLWLSDDLGSQKFSNSVEKELNNKGEIAKLLMDIIKSKIVFNDLGGLFQFS